ncbi:MAG: hypothetical protein SGI83_14170 [Bacteroidota bacterium]|nr:hypothetical protein [Bacteroidota bacterium]
MDLRETILAEHSKANCTKIVYWIGNNSQRFDTVVHLFLTDKDPRVVQRSAWPLSELVLLYPALIKKHLGKILQFVTKPGLHDAVKRNTVKILQFINIPRQYEGKVMNLCFDYLLDPNEKPAVKAFSLTVLQHLSQQYPEIKQELKMIIEDRWEFETAAFHSRAKKILKEIN